MSVLYHEFAPLPLASASPAAYIVAGHLEPLCFSAVSVGRW